MLVPASLLVLCIVHSQASSPSKTTQPPVAKRAVCTPTSYGDDQLDDTPAIASAIVSCGNGGTIVIPSGTTYSIRSTLKFTGCAGCEFQLEGTLKASDDYEYWSNYEAIILLEDISTATIYSSTGDGVIDGNGQDAYDAFAANSSLSRPTLVYITGSSDISIYGFSVLNPPNVFFSNTGTSEQIEYASLTMTASSKSTNAPKNTDGFDVGETTYTTIREVYVSNQDDCIAFKPGANYVTVESVTCTGTTHGVSIGSLGESGDSVVSNVYVSNLTMSGCTKAAGIKLYASGPDYGTATVSNVTYQGVTVDECEYAVQIQSCYNGDTSYCEEYPSTATLTDVYFNDFSGTTDTTYEPVVANLDCPAAGTCDVYLEDFDVSPPSGTAEILCANFDVDPGVTCTSGASG
jgi:galacturan 1,4-alpha-galacturonidase